MSCSDDGLASARRCPGSGACACGEVSSACVAGKVAIQKEDLQKYHNRDTWFQLQHVDADSEVQVRPSAQPRKPSPGTPWGLETRTALTVAEDVGWASVSTGITMSLLVLGARPGSVQGFWVFLCHVQLRQP